MTQTKATTSKKAKPAEIDFGKHDLPLVKKDEIRIRGARTHNLKNINLDYHATNWWSSPVCLARANLRWRLIPYMLKASDVM